MISQWWAIAPPLIWITGNLTANKTDRTVFGYLVMALSGLGWLIYGTLRNEITIWVSGALLASAYYIKIVELARGSDHK